MAFGFGLRQELERMEALSLLRQCTMARKTAREEKDYYVFGHRRVPKDTPTAWKSQVQSEVRVRMCVRMAGMGVYCLSKLSTKIPTQKSEPPVT